MDFSRIPYKTYSNALALARAIFKRMTKPSLEVSFCWLFPGDLKISLEAAADSQSYTFLKKPGWAVIHLGLLTACEAANLQINQPVKADDVLACAKVLKLSLDGLAYHEVSHLVMTDMSCELLVELQSNPTWNKYLPFIKDFVNICEDPTAENGLSRKTGFKRTKKLFRHLTKAIFKPKGAQYQDDGTIASFLNYLLLYLRIGPKAIAGKNIVFEELSKKGLRKRLREAYKERNARKRMEKQIDTAKWILTEMKWDAQQLPPQQTRDRPTIILIDSTTKQKGKSPEEYTLRGEDLPLPPVVIAQAADGQAGKQIDGDVIDLTTQNGSEQKGGEEQPGPQGDGKDSTENDGSSENQDADGQSPDQDAESQGSPSDSDDSEQNDAEEAEEQVDTEDFDWEVGDEDPLTSEDAEDDFDRLENVLGLDALADDNYSGYFATDYQCNSPWIVESFYNDCVKGLKSLPAELASALIELKAASAPVDVHRLPDGDEIDIDDYIDSLASNERTLDLYRRSEPGREITDLAVSVLVDVSGSMEGANSYCAYQTAVMATLACEEAKVPIEIAAFSSDGAVYLKRFDDEMDGDVQNALGILNSDLKHGYNKTNADAIRLWWNTKLERALPIIIDGVKRYDKKEQKLVIVVTDGETDDRPLVRSLVQAARDDGIVVIGVGIGSNTRCLAECFERFQAFTSTSLGNLPKYVSEEITEALASAGFRDY